MEQLAMLQHISTMQQHADQQAATTMDTRRKPFRCIGLASNYAGSGGQFKVLEGVKNHLCIHYI
jgi:hypothetical protein